MSYVIMGLIVVAMIHFVYESIIAPSLRSNLRFELLRLRDDLRQLKLNDRHFHDLQDQINALLSVLSRLDLPTLIALERARQRDSVLKRRIERRTKALDDCSVPEARAIRARCAEIAAQAIAVNHGAWFGFILPAVLASTGYAKAKSLIGTFLSLPERELQGIIRDLPAANSQR